MILQSLWSLKSKWQILKWVTKTLPHITHKMLSSQLSELKKHELITRKVYAAVPPKVEYTISAKGKKAMPAIEVIRDYGIALMKENGSKEELKEKKEGCGKEKWLTKKISAANEQSTFNKLHSA